MDLILKDFGWWKRTTIGQMHSSNFWETGQEKDLSVSALDCFQNSILQSLYRFKKMIPRQTWKFLINHAQDWDPYPVYFILPGTGLSQLRFIPTIPSMPNSRPVPHPQFSFLPFLRSSRFDSDPPQWPRDFPCSQPSLHAPWPSHVPTACISHPGAFPVPSHVFYLDHLRLLRFGDRGKDSSMPA